MEFASEVEAGLREFAPSGSAEIRENGGRLAHVANSSWELRGPSEKPLLQIWFIATATFPLWRCKQPLRSSASSLPLCTFIPLRTSCSAISSPTSKLSALVLPKAGAMVLALSCGSNNFSFLHSIIPVTSRSRPCKMLLSYLGVMFWLFSQKLGTMVPSPSSTSPDV
jgi:hypothetical protein